MSTSKLVGIERLYLRPDWSTVKKEVQLMGMSVLVIYLKEFQYLVIYLKYLATNQSIGPLLVVLDEESVDQIFYGCM